MDPERIIVRINPAGTEDFTRDLRAIEQTRYRYLMLATIEEPESLMRLADYFVMALTSQSCACGR